MEDADLPENPSCCWRLCVVNAAHPRLAPPWPEGQSLQLDFVCTDEKFDLRGKKVIEKESDKNDPLMEHIKQARADTALLM